MLLTSKPPLFSSRRYISSLVSLLQVCLFVSRSPCHASTSCSATVDAVFMRSSMFILPTLEHTCRHAMACASAAMVFSFAVWGLAISQTVFASVDMFVSVVNMFAGKAFSDGNLKWCDAAPSVWLYLSIFRLRDCFHAGWVPERVVPCALQAHMTNSDHSLCILSHAL